MLVRLRTLTAKSPAEARGIRKALKAAGLKFEFKSAVKRRRKRNPAKKKASAKRKVQRTRSKSRRRR